MIKSPFRKLIVNKKLNSTKFNQNFRIVNNEKLRMYFDTQPTLSCEKSTNTEPKHSSKDNSKVIIRFNLLWKKNEVKGTLRVTQKIVNVGYL